MTGEIDLLGNVTKIGGLEYKINGGKKAGIKHFFISTENKKDFEKIKKDDSKLCKGITVKFVKVIFASIGSSRDVWIFLWYRLSSNCSLPADNLWWSQTIFDTLGSECYSLRFD